MEPQVGRPPGAADRGRPADGWAGGETQAQPAAGAQLAPTAGAALALLAVALAVVGQYLLAVPRVLRLGAASYLFGLAAFFWLADLRPDGGPPLYERVLGRPWTGPLWGWRTLLTERSWRGLQPVAHLRRAAARAPLRAAMLVLAAVLAVAVVAVLRQRADGAMPYWDVFGMWLLSIALYLVAIIQPQRFLRPGYLLALVGRRRLVLIDILWLWAAALVLRVPYLGSRPGVINGDEGIVGTMARGIATGGNMFGTQFAYGSLFYLIRSPLVVLFGNGLVQLRLVDAVLGSLAAPAVYLAGRQLFGRRVGLIAGILLAATHMHVHLSRIALGHAVDATLTAVVLFSFCRGLQRRDSGWMALAGVGLGLSQYGYVGGRLLGLVFGAYVAVLVLTQPRYVAAVWQPIASALGASLLTALPMIRWAIDRPNDYLARVEGVGFVQSGGLAAAMEHTGDPAWVVMARQFRDAFLSIVSYPASAFYDARIPMLPLGLAVLFVLGGAFALWRVRDRRHLLLVLEVIGALSVLALGQNVTVAAYRVAGVMPVFILLAAMALVLLTDGALSGLGYRGWVGGLATAGLVAGLVTYDVAYYFTDHLPHCRYTDERSAAASVAAEYIGSLPADTTVLALTRPYLSLGVYPSVAFLSGREEVDLSWPRPELPAPGEEGSEKYIYSLPQGTDDLAELVSRAGRVVVLAMPERRAELQAIAGQFAGGRPWELRWCGGVAMEVLGPRWSGVAGR